MANTHESLELQTWLPRFFQEFQDYQVCRSPLPAHEPEPEPLKVDVSQLSNWFDAMARLMVQTRRAAFEFDPWEIAGLGKDEVRNSAVLAWLLNPKGSHGLGDAGLLGLLEELRNFDSRFPSSCSPFCRVRLESNPDGDNSNRIDIEIDDADFYVLIEVKIGACEGKDQLKRYGDISKQLAGNRPWTLVFLTPRGLKSTTAGSHVDSVLPISWRQLAFSIGQSIKASSVGKSHTSGITRKLAEQAVQQFLKKMKKF